MRKWNLSALLALVVIFSMSIPAMAADKAPDAPVPVEATPEVPMAAADEPAAIATTANGWVSEGGSWYYYKNGQRVYNDWLQDGGVWYFMDPDGKMLEGFAQIDLGRADDGWYYFSEKHDGTYGHVMTGWQVINGSWRYFNPKHDGTYGRMVTNDWLLDGGVWYFLDPDGKMLEGLTQIDLGRGDDGWYYFSEKHDGTYGHVMTGWQWFDGGWSTDENGWDVWVSGAWYYFDPQHNGTFGRAYDNGWNKIGGEYYYFYDDGKMARNTVVDGYHVDGNGVRSEKETVKEPWFTDEEIRRAEQELYEYAKEKYGLKAQKRTGTYAHDYYFGLDWAYPTIDGMMLKADNEYDGLIEYGKFCVDQTYKMWAGGRANYGDVGITYEYDDVYNHWGYGNWGYHIYVFYGTSGLL